jgi:hypothetical protein
VEWTPADAYGNRELKGIPEGLVRGFSKRTGQIDAELDRLEADGAERTPRLVKWAVQATRKPKQQETPDTLYARWHQEAAERGVDSDALVRQVTAWRVPRGVSGRWGLRPGGSVLLVAPVEVAPGCAGELGCGQQPQGGVDSLGERTATGAAGSRLVRAASPVGLRTPV